MHLAPAPFWGRTVRLRLVYVDGVLIDQRAYRVDVGGLDRGDERRVAPRARLRLKRGAECCDKNHHRNGRGQRAR